MKLFDFTDFDPFNEMRAAMGTDRLGHFELFDPRLHLTGDERSLLARQGLTVEPGQLGRLLDQTLCYKNSRVIWVVGTTFHLAECPSVERDASARVATSLRPLGPDLGVCTDCLQQLGYQGFDQHKARKDRYNARVVDEFSLEEFWREYPPYPLKMDRELVKPLGQPPGSVPEGAD